MTLPSQTHQIDEIFTRLSQYRYVGEPGYKDNFYNGRPLLRLLRERKLTAKGGRKIAHRVNLGTTANGHFYGARERVTFKDDRNFTHAEFPWAFLFESMFVDEREVFYTEGNKAKVATLHSDVEMDARERMQDKLTTALCRTSKDTALDGSGAPNTILEIASATGELGGLNPATAGQSKWAAQVNGSAITFSSTGPSKLRAISADASMGNKHSTDAYLLPKAYYLEGLDIGDGKVAINQDAKTKLGTSNADLALGNLTINQRPCLWDPAWDALQSAKAVAMNFNGMHWVEAPELALRARPWKATWETGMFGFLSVLDLAGQLTASNRQTQGALTQLQ